MKKGKPSGTDEQRERWRKNRKTYYKYHKLAVDEQNSSRRRQKRQEERARIEAQSKPIQTKFGELYPIMFIARRMRVSFYTVRSWIYKGYIPPGRFTRNRNHYYTLEEVQVILSAWVLCNRSLKGKLLRGGDKPFTYQQETWTFRQFCQDKIRELRMRDQYNTLWYEGRKDGHNDTVDE